MPRQVLLFSGASAVGKTSVLKSLLRLLARPVCTGFERDALRHTMPSGVCSYCVGERRVGSAFQQGVVDKISFEEAPVCGV